MGMLPAFLRGMPAFRIQKRLLWTLAVACALSGQLLVSSCGNLAEKETPTSRSPPPVWPAEPDLPRFIYETALRSPSSVMASDEAERMRRSLTGDDSADRPAFEKPGAVVARQGRIYVADTAQRRIAVFDVARRRFFRFGFRPPAALALPSGLALDDSMNVYVADALLRRVFVYDPLGLHVRTIGGSGDFERPTGVAVSKDGQRIYVVDRAHNDSANHKVVAFDADGQRLWTIGSRGDGPAQFNVPLQATVGPDGTLHVLDSGNFRVQSFDPNGRFLRSIGKVGSAPGKFSRPRGLAVDDEGKVYVSDAGFNNLQVFDEGGRLLLAIGKASLEDGPGQYALLAGVAVDETGRIYLVDQLFNKIEVIRPLAPAEGLALRPAAEQ